MITLAILIAIIAIIVIVSLPIIIISVLTIVLESPTSMISAMTSIVMKWLERENDRRSFGFLFTKLSESDVLVSESILEFFFEFFDQRNFFWIKFITIVIAWKIQVDFPIGICHSFESI